MFGTLKTTCKFILTPYRFAKELSAQTHNRTYSNQKINGITDTSEFKQHHPVWGPHWCCHMQKYYFSGVGGQDCTKNRKNEWYNWYHWITWHYLAWGPHHHCRGSWQSYGDISVRLVLKTKSDIRYWVKSRTHGWTTGASWKWLRKLSIIERILIMAWHDSPSCASGIWDEEGTIETCDKLHQQY